MESDRDANGTARRRNSNRTFQLCDRGPTPLLEGENDEKPRFFRKCPHFEDP